MGWTVTPWTLASGAFSLALAMISSYARVTSSEEARLRRTPPTSLLCVICVEATFSTTGKPMPWARDAASSAEVASRVSVTRTP